MEQTYIMIKPDGVQRGLVGQIIARFETKGYYLRGLKMMTVERSHGASCVFLRCVTARFAPLPQSSSVICCARRNSRARALLILARRSLAASLPAPTSRFVLSLTRHFPPSLFHPFLTIPFCPPPPTAEKHYADLSAKPFFGDLVDYMCSGPVVCMVWEGKEVVKTGRKIIGATNPL
jgi:nucleoside diphosphate kinase